MAIANVSSFAELKTAIEDATSTEIIVNSDIVFGDGAKINIAKNNIIIDFSGHTITDSSNLNIATTIYVPSTTNSISVTAKNAVWNGKNYYGVIGVYDGNTNTTINLENINYTGPQFVFNKNGITNIHNCTVTIDKNNSSARAQEFCEANRLNLSGNVNVTSNSTSDAVIWFSGTDASLTVAENAKFEVNAASTYFLYTDVSPEMTFNQNSSTTISTKGGLFYASGASSHIAKSFVLEENASFVASKNVSNTVPMFKCISNFTLKSNSTFRLFSEVISSTPLMYFAQAANINITSVQNVVLYNRGGYIFSFGAGTASTPNLININTQMLRLWNIAKYPVSDAGGFDNAPTTEYHKANYEQNVSLNIKASNSQLLSTDNNLTSEDTGYPISNSIKLLSSSVISMGKMSLNVDEITNQSTSIKGLTNANANIKVEYLDQAKLTTADSYGSFALDLDGSIAINTSVKISTNKHFLTKWLTTTVDGSVTITSLSPLKFNTFTTKSNQSLIFRQNPDWSIQITDTRVQGEEWYLYAYIQNPLSSGENNLDNVLIYKKDNVEYILSQTPLLVYSGKSDKNSQITALKWDNIEGFLLKLENQIYPSGEYKTEILWQVSTEPLD